jgi:hypothetical protein
LKKNGNPSELELFRGLNLLEAEAVGVDLAGHELGVLLGGLVDDLDGVGHVHALLAEAERVLRAGSRFRV